MGIILDEKRKFQRYRENLPITFSILISSSLDNMKSTWEGETNIVDISEGGILFKHDNPIPISSFLEIEIKVPDIKLPVNLTGRVTRIEELIQDEEYLIGLSFQHIFENDKKLLIKHIQQMKEKFSNI